MKLNVGCGRNILAGDWKNLDSMALPGVDVVADLEECRTQRIDLGDDSVEEFLLSHLIEHIRNPLPMMQELHRIAKPGAKCVVRCPYGSTDDAFEDPTHVRQYFLNSFGYFSQPFYWRADYGYRGDWQPKNITLLVEEARFRGKAVEEIIASVHAQRNVVREMVAELIAIKPIREPLKELQRPLQLSIGMV